MTAASRFIAAPLILALIGSAAPSVDAAAQRLSIRPQIGIYIPTKDIITAAQSGEVAKIEAGPSFGAAVGLSFGKRFGIEATGAYVPTTFSQGTGNTINKQNAKLFLGNALAVLYILPPTGMLSLFVTGGAGVVSHGGVAFTSQSKTSDVAAVFGAGAGLKLGGIQLVAGTDLFSYTATYTGSQQTASEAKQLDIQIRLGFGVPLGH